MNTANRATTVISAETAIAVMITGERSGRCLRAARETGERGGGPAVAGR